MRTFKEVSLKLHQRLIRILFNYLLNNFSKKVIFYAHMISIQSNLIVVNLELFSILLIYLPWKTNWTLFPYFINTLCNLKKKITIQNQLLKVFKSFLNIRLLFWPNKKCHSKISNHSTKTKFLSCYLCLVFKLHVFLCFWNVIYCCFVFFSTCNVSKKKLL